MAVDTGTAILILGVFVLPGFITLTLRERLYIVRGEEAPFERLLSALLYSAVIYGSCWWSLTGSVCRRST
jgi:hydrogenase-4 membrane subunit HyfE